VAKKKRGHAILANKFFVPADLVPTGYLRRNWYYTWEETIFEEQTDDYGDVILDIHKKPVFEVRTENRSLKTYEEVFTAGDESHYAFPTGNHKKIAELRKRFHVTDLRSIAPLGFPLRLRRYVKRDPRWKKGQKKAVRAFARHGSGILKSGTGSGKTVMGAAVMCRLGLRTIILSKRKDGNSHWLEEIRKLTNIKEMEEELGRQLVGVYTGKRRKFYPITIATVQSLNTKRGFADLVAHQNEFGLLIGDEVHELVTEKYKVVPASFNALAKCGLTATDERDDKLHFLEYDLFGPIIYEGKGRQMEPIVTFIKTSVKIPEWIYKTNWHRGAKWNKCMQILEKSSPRYDLIMKWIYDDIEDDRTIACISTRRRSFIKELEKRLRQDGYRVAYVDGNTKNRDQIYRDVNDGKYDVLCAGKVMDALVNIPTLDSIHLVSPVVKHSSVTQILGRSRREWKGKRNPVIRVYVDKGGQMDGAFKSVERLCLASSWKVEYSEPGLSDSVGMGMWQPRRG
jgi:superfamily II DNA or RNA helicase